MIFEIEGLVIMVRKPEISDLPYLCELLSSESYVVNLGGTGGLSKQQLENKAFQILEDNANDFSPQKYYLIEDKFKSIPLGLTWSTNFIQPS